MLKTLPLPDVKRALLPSNGWEDGHPTWHEYIYTRAEHRAFSFWFKCTETGSVRKWGLQGPPKDK